MDTQPPAEPQSAPTSPAASRPSAEEVRRQRLLIAAAIAIPIVLLIVLAIGTALAVNYPSQTSSVRDVAIIFLAFLSIGVGVMLVLLIYQVTKLTLLLRDEIKPLLESVNETMNTVRGTTVFMSENVVQPSIRVASTLSGVWRALETLAGIRASVQPKQRKE